ncbi:hydantoinase [Boletus edulis BED1]|uniref:Hydantoinase n=1 Tax=Boletus edulis BED1 TaxID=1328754 RepID=A0AAD4BS56_BOLED|nr:hydantoinase [Boletus edulis BED1]
MALRLGVDVGGTNTDAVLLNSADKHVLASAKHPTTPDVTQGIQQAIQSVLDQVPQASDIQAISIGTTHFVNALVERNRARLDRVAVIRLCGQFTHGTPPFVGFPPDLKNFLKGPCFLVSGGLQIDGSEISTVNATEIESACDRIDKENIQAVAIISVFAPIDLNFKQEEYVASIVQAKLPHLNIVCSKDVAHIGLLERENATILNASLLRYAKKTVIGFQKAARVLHLTCPVFITSNDGTLLSCAQAAKLPIRTFSSGPTNSMRGAAFLASLQSDISKESALVVDIGGTTTDIGMLLFVFTLTVSNFPDADTQLSRPSGFPRQAAACHELCGVLLNFSMPHVTSIGLGGGSLVRQDSHSKRVTIGPDSVGHRITSEARIFNGVALTATDIAVAAGRASIGDVSRVAGLDQPLIDGAQKAIETMLQNTLDAMKTSAADIPVYLVGGGSILAPDQLVGVSRVHRFPHYDVANAVGAAIAQISGTVDSFEDISSTPISEVRKAVEAKAIARAVASGATPDRVSIVESEVIPIAYTTGRCRFYVKAAGDWTPTHLARIPYTYPPAMPDALPGETFSLDSADSILTYQPKVQDNQWFLSEIDLEWISDGCYVLGCGGGGSPLHVFLELREMVRAGAIIRVIDSGSLAPDALIGWGGAMGSPEVCSERLLGNEYNEACTELWAFMGITKPDVLCALEIGGGNGMINMITAATKNYDIPIVDGDFMGRAYPTWHQTTANVYDETGRAVSLLPCAISSGDGNVMIMTKAKRDSDVDAAFRAACIEMGTFVGQASRPLRVKDLGASMIVNTVSLSWRIGRAIALARKQSNIDQIGQVVVDAVGGPKTAKVLFSGKIIDVRRRLYKGHTIGEVVIAPLSADEEVQDNSDRPEAKFDGTLTVPFKNENLFAEHTSPDGQMTMLATVPDLIAVLDAQSGSALGTPQYKYGLRVLVLGITAAPQWTSTQRGLELGGPSAFGFPDTPYKPLGVYCKPRSVIEEYADRT